MSMDFELAEKIVRAREHPLKVKLLQLLSIYSELSTADLAAKSGKSKPTVLKHLDELIQIGEVQKRTEISPGAYDKNIYSLASRPKFTIRGQDLRNDAKENPDFLLSYISYQLSELLLIKDIVDSMVNYQRRLNELVSSNIDNIEFAMELLRDNLGARSLKYMTRNDLFGEGSNEEREYLKLTLTLPIRRLIEQVTNSEWELDGNIWEYESE